LTTIGLGSALERAGLSLRRDEPLARHTTLCIGGPTPFFVEPRDTEELRRTVDLLGEAAMPWRVLGAGSNLLVDDEPLDFAVIATSKLARPAAIDGTTVRADAGLFLPRLVRDTAARGLAGLEFGIGVPGSVGGALRMNAGAWGSDMSRVVRAVTAVRTRDGCAVEGPFSPRFGYRTSGVGTDMIVTRVIFDLTLGDGRAILAETERLIGERRTTQPTATRSAGCAFRNPPGDSAGHLIDAAGLKGLTRGEAEVSTHHGNFVLNRGNARASDVRALLAEVRRRVQDQTGVELQGEIVNWRRLH